MRDDCVISVRFVWYTLLTATLLAAVSFVAYWAQPTWLGFERRNFVSSHQYIESKRSLLLKLVAEYDDNATEITRFEVAFEANGDRNGGREVVRGLLNQQESLKARIHEEAATLPPSEVPSSVWRIVK